MLPIPRFKERTSFMFAYCFRNQIFAKIFRSPKYLTLLILALVFHMGHRAISIYQPFLFGDLVQLFVDEPSATNKLLQLIALFAATYLSVQLFTTIAEQFSDRVMTMFSLELKKKSFAHLLGHSVARKESGTGSFIELWSRGVRAVESSIRSIVYSVALPIYGLGLALTAVFAALDPLLFFVMIAGSLVYFCWLFFAQRFIRPAIRQANRKDDTLSEAAFDQLRNREVFQIFRKNYALDQRYYDAATEQRQLKLKVFRLNQIWSLGNSTIYSITLFALLVTALFLLQQGQLNAGDMATILALSSTLFGPVQRINRGLLNLRTAQVDAENLAEKLTEGEEDFAHAREKVTLSDISKIDAKDITIKHGDLPVLEGFNLQLKAGEKILLRGASGSGKTSFANALAGLRAPDGGSVGFKSANGDEADLHSVHTAITFASQDEHIMNLSIADNIMLGQYDEARLDWAVNKAGLSQQMLERIKSGENIGESGSNVSGGERKRIMMARALYHMNNVTIFDESLSNLDSATRDLVLDKLLSESDLTLICISHDDALLERFDRVIEM